MFTENESNDQNNSPMTNFFTIEKGSQWNQGPRSGGGVQGGWVIPLGEACAEALRGQVLLQTEAGKRVLVFMVSGDISTAGQPRACVRLTLELRRMRFRDRNIGVSVGTSKKSGVEWNHCQVCKAQVLDKRLLQFTGMDLLLYSCLLNFAFCLNFILTYYCYRVSVLFQFY